MGRLLARVLPIPPRALTVVLLDPLITSSRMGNQTKILTIAHPNNVCKCDTQIRRRARPTRSTLGRPSRQELRPCRRVELVPNDVREHRG